MTFNIKQSPILKLNLTISSEGVTYVCLFLTLHNYCGTFVHHLLTYHCINLVLLITYFMTNH